MGAKTPEQVKRPNKPRPPVKCDICGRKFLNVSALKSHHKFLHLKNESAKALASKKQENARPVKKKMVPLHMLKRVNPPEAKEVRKTTASIKPANIAVKSPTATRKAEFECPICAEKFPVYFTAFRHIQKNHCVDSQGEQVPPNSPHLVKPIRIETCASCSQQIRSTTPHECPKMQVYKDQFMCLGCDQVFNGLVLFQHHVKGLHADGSLNYFFSSRNEFESWRSELQEAISNEFIRLNKQKAKEIYHCSHQPSSISTATRLCPASIMVREYLKGIHVCYYKEHFGHVIEDDIDVPLKNFNKYSITLYTKESEDLRLEAEEDNELYVQFKNMLKCIITDAVKVDSVTLKDLFGRALEMTSVLKNYHGEDHSTRLVVKNLSDDQISKSLDSLKPKQGKRKQNLEIETKNVVAKKIKKSPLSVENGVSTRLSRSSATVNKSVTFKKSIPKKNEETSDKEEETLEKNNEGTPQKSQRKKTEELSVKKANNKAEPQITEATDVKKPEELPAPAIRSHLQSPSSFNDSYKNFVDQNFKCLTETSTPKSKVNVKKKEVVKTRIGQFKPGSPKHMSPKHTASPKSPKEVIKEVPVTPTIFKAKPDIEYIVKERENDCNILILKI